MTFTELMNLKKDQLVEKCKEKGIPHTGTKKVLATRLLEARDEPPVPRATAREVEPSVEEVPEEVPEEPLPEPQGAEPRARGPLPATAEVTPPPPPPPQEEPQAPHSDLDLNDIMQSIEDYVKRERVITKIIRLLNREGLIR